MERMALNQAFRQALRALSRFPLVFAAGVIGTVAALFLNHLPYGDYDARTIAGNLAMTAWLGVPLLFALSLLAESRRLPQWAALLLQAGGLASLAVYHHLLIATPWPIRISRFWLCMLAAHLCATLATSLVRGADVDSFWRYNQKLAARLGLSLGYGFLILLGLGVALASVKGLFEMDFPDAWFLDPGIFALGVFNTWFFLAGVPRPEEAHVPATADAGLSPEATAHAADLAYPRQLRVLAQLILMPLVCIYMVIVYAYAVHTLTLWRWPTGWVTWLLLCFCALGLVCLFLAQPLADRGGSRWVKLYCRHFHIALVPVLILLFAAIGKRVQEYGITENRYFVVALGVWLAGIVLHAAVDAPRDLRILPASLCLVSVLAAFGPWGAFEVSRKSQEQRLKTLLESHGMLVGGKLAKAPGRIPRRAIREIGGIAGFLEERGRLPDLKEWIPAMDDSGETYSVAWHKALDGRFSLLEALELPYMPPEATGPGRAEAVAFNCRGLAVPMRKVSGYDFLFTEYRPDGEVQGGDGFFFDYDSSAGVIRFRSRDTAGPSLDLAGHFQRLRERYPDAYDLNLPPEEMILQAEDAGLKVLVHVRGMDGMADPEDGARLRGFAADVFVALKGKLKPRPKTPALAQARPGSQAEAVEPQPQP